MLAVQTTSHTSACVFWTRHSVGIVHAGNQDFSVPSGVVLVPENPEIFMT
jgi:hypothetical protein